MRVHSFQAEVISRGARMLRTALGPAIAAWLEDPSVVEVMLNPDGRLWIDRLSSGLVETQARLAPAEGERIVRLVAHHVADDEHRAGIGVDLDIPGLRAFLPPVEIGGDIRLNAKVEQILVARQAPSAVPSGVQAF